MKDNVASLFGGPSPVSVATPNDLVVQELELFAQGSASRRNRWICRMLLLS
jgi:hypothetical protein